MMMVNDSASHQGGNAPGARKRGGDRNPGYPVISDTCGLGCSASLPAIVYILPKYN